MDTKQKLLKRIDDLIALANKTIEFIGTDEYDSLRSRSRTQSLSFIHFLNGTSHPNYLEFEDTSRSSNETFTKRSKKILDVIKHDIQNDYYLSAIKGLVSAEIFYN